MNFTITTPNQTVALVVSLRRGRGCMECTFWPMAQAAVAFVVGGFFRAFEEKYEVLQVSATPTRTCPAAGTVYFRPTREQQATLIEDIDTLFTDLYEY